MRVWDLLFDLIARCGEAMPRYLVCAAFAIATTGIADAEDIPATQLYKLCMEQNPECLTKVREAFDAAVAAQQAPGADPRFKFCLPSQTPTDEQLVAWFLKAAQNAGYGLSFPAKRFEAFVLSSALPCR